MRVFPLLLATAFTAFDAMAADGNRLTHLDDTSPFWPSAKSAKFITPQWIGEPGVDAVVILAIDDMRDTAKYETFLRPILDRLKRVDGRAPVSIMTNNVPPGDPQLQAWLKEGVRSKSTRSRIRARCSARRRSKTQGAPCSAA